MKFTHEYAVINTADNTIVAFFNDMTDCVWFIKKREIGNKYESLKVYRRLS